MTRRSLLTPIVVLALGAGGFWWALKPQPVPVDTAEASRGSIAVTVDEEGVTRIREVYTVSAPVGGRIMRSPLDPGDAVVAGETVVAAIQPQAPAILDARARAELGANLRAAEAALGLAEAERGKAQAELDYWRGQLKRDEMLLERSAIPAIQLEQTKLDLATRQAALASAEAQVRVRERERDRARALLIEPDADGVDPGAPACCLHLDAPVDGAVLAVLVESERVVPAGTPLVTVGDPADLEIVVDLLSADAVRVKPGDPAQIERWGGDGALAAHVRRVEPAGFTKISALGIEEQRVRVILDLDTPAAERTGLGHDYRVFARIRVLLREDVVTVPMAALFRQGDGWALFLVQDGVARLRAVALGARNSHAAEVVAGLAAGEMVVLHPGDRVEDGVRVVERATLSQR